MGVLISKSTRVLVQGITGYQGEFHAARMREFGTQIVAGVTPGKGGTNVQGVPVFETIAEAVRQTGATAACIFVPAKAAKDAALEAIEEGLDPVVIITEGIPVLDSVQIVAWAAQRGVHVIGPNCPGLTAPGECKMGIMPNPLFRPGPVGVISRSGTLTYEIVAALTQHGIGQSTALGLGGDPVVGMSFTDGLRLFEDDAQTKAVILIGEIGGNAEEDAAQFIRTQMHKPVVGYIAGRTAPSGKRMGHAGAVISGSAGTAASKMSALQGAGVQVATLPADVVQLVREVM